MYSVGIIHPIRFLGKRLLSKKYVEIFSMQKMRAG
jgi:hypothetical protein